MGEAVPAVEVDVPAPVASDDASLLADAAPEGTKPDANKTEPDSTPVAKPEGDAGDAKPAEGKTDAGEASLLAEDDEGKPKEKADGVADAKPDAAPEKYEAFTLPEGMSLDEEALAKATPILKEFGLNQEKAQKLVSLYADLTKATVEGAQAQAVSQHKQLISEWTAKVKAHPEFGGDKLPQSKAAAIKAINTLAGSAQEAAELRNMLSEWGISNHPALFGLLVRAGTKLSEDTMVTSDAASQASEPKKPWELLYPQSSSKG